jgi:hypothetical protein
MVDSGTCGICGEPVEAAKATTDMETGSLVHAACLAQKQRAERAEGDQEEAAT